MGVHFLTALHLHEVACRNQDKCYDDMMILIICFWMFQTMLETVRLGDAGICGLTVGLLLSWISLFQFFFTGSHLFISSSPPCRPYTCSHKDRDP